MYLNVFVITPGGKLYTLLQGVIFRIAFVLSTLEIVAKYLFLFAEKIIYPFALCISSILNLFADIDASVR